MGSSHYAALYGAVREACINNGLPVIKKNWGEYFVLSMISGSMVTGTNYGIPSTLPRAITVMMRKHRA